MAKKIIVGMSPEFYEWVEILKNLVDQLHCHLHKIPLPKATTTVVFDEEDDDE